MKYRLIVADKIKLPIRLTLNDNGKKAEHKFSLTAQRIAQDEVRALMADGEKTVRELLVEKISGWEGQRLVIGEDDEPAPFSSEALEVLLSLPGVDSIVFGTYLRELAVADSSEGKAKN
jgi:hypothetical protein